MRALVLAVLASGCSSLLGIEELQGPDGGTPPEDTADAGPIPQTIQLTGTVQRIGITDGSAIAGAQVELLGDSDEPIQTVTSDAAGRYEITIETGNRPVTGALRSSDPTGTSNRTQTLINNPITSTTEITLQHLDRDLLEQFSQFCGGGPALDFPVFMIGVVIGQNMPAVGIPVKVAPNASLCTLDGGSPAPGDVTGSDGIVFAFGAPPGPVDIMAGPASVRVNSVQATNYIVTLHL